MQIIIDIPIKWLFDMKNKKFYQTDSLYQKILNGTPLSEEHGKIIDESQITEVYIETTEERYVHGQNTVFTVPRISIVGTDAPTIIPANRENKE